MTTGEKIKALRKKKKITQIKLAELTGIPLSTIQKYERDARNPKLNALDKIAKALDTSINELLDKNELRHALEYEIGNRAVNELYNIIHDKKYLLNAIQAYLVFTENYKCNYYIDVSGPTNADAPNSIPLTDEQIEDIVNKICELVKFEFYKLEKNKSE